MDKETIRLRLQGLTALVNTYQDMVTDPVMSLFLKQIHQLNAVIDSLAPDDISAIKQQGKTTLQLIKSIESSVFSVLIPKLADGLQITNLKNQELIEQIFEDMKEYQTALLSSKSNAFLPIETMTALLKSYHDNFYQHNYPHATKNIPEEALEPSARKKTKPRVVTITEQGAVPLKKLHTKREQLNNKVKKQMDRLKTCYDKARELALSSLSSKEKQDGLIAEKSQVILSSRAQIETLKAERKLLNAELFLCNASNNLSGKKLEELNLEQRGNVVTCLKIINPGKPPINPEQLTKGHLQLLHKKGKELKEKYDYPNNVQMTQFVIDHDRAYLNRLKPLEKIISHATDLLIKRQNELRNPEILAEPQKKLANLNEETVLFITSIDELYQSTQPLPVDNEPDIRQQLAKHHHIYAKMAPLITKHNNWVSRLHQDDAILRLPLQADRINKQIELNQKLIEKLKSIQVRLINNSQKLDSLREEVVRQRTNAAAEAYHFLFSEATQALERIKIMRRNTNNIDTINKAKITIQNLCDDIEANLNPGSGTLMQAEIDDIKTSRLATIKSAMEPVLLQLINVNSRFQARTEQLKTRVAALQEIKNTTLKDVDKFSQNHIQTINNNLKQIKQPCRNEYLPLDYKLLHSTEKQIEEQEKLAKNLIGELGNRHVSEEAKVIDSMINAIGKEEQTLQSKNSSDARLTILNEIKAGLQNQLTDYLNLKTADKNTFITQSIETINTNLSSGRLRQLSDVVATPLIKFIRNLLQPISRLIQKFQPNTYRSSFFAKPTERNVTQAAQTALNALQQTLCNRESQHQPAADGSQGIAPG